MNTSLILDAAGRPITSDFRKDIVRGQAADVHRFYHPAHGATPELVTAIRLEAERGRPRRQHEYLDDMYESDLVYRGAVDQRVLAVASRQINVRPVNDSDLELQIAEDWRSILKQTGVRDGLTPMQENVTKGVSFLWIDYRHTKVPTPKPAKKGQAAPPRIGPEMCWWPVALKQRDPRLFIYDLKTKQWQVEGKSKPVPIPAGSMVIHQHSAKAGMPLRTGVGRACMWIYFIKNILLKDELTYNESFWKPWLIGRVNDIDSEEGAVVEAALEAIGTDGRAMLNNSSKIETLDFARAGGQGTFQLMADRLDQYMTKAILGQLQTSDSTQSQHSQAKAVVGRDMLYGTLIADDMNGSNESLRRDLLINFTNMHYGVRDEYPTLDSEAEGDVDVSLMPAVTSLVKEVMSGALPRDAGLAALKRFHQMTDEEAEEQMGSAGMAPAVPVAGIGGGPTGIVPPQTITGDGSTPGAVREGKLPPPGKPAKGGPGNVPGEYGEKWDMTGDTAAIEQAFTRQRLMTAKFADSPRKKKLDMFENAFREEMAQHERALQEAMAKAAAGVDEVTGVKEEWRGSDYGKLKRGINKIMAEAGFEEVKAAAVESVVSMNKNLANLTGESVGPEMEALIKESADIGLEWINEMPGKAQASLREAVSKAFTQPISREELARSIADKFSGGDVDKAMKQIGDGIREIKQKLLNATAEEYGYDAFLYLGPPGGDISIREFCRNMVGRAYTKEMLDECDNGMLPNVSETLGGYGCRHTLLPLMSTDVEDVYPGALVEEYSIEEADIGSEKNPRTISFVVPE